VVESGIGSHTLQDASGMSNFRPIDRQTGFLLPPSVDEWLPEKHLARFVVEVIDGLDLSAMSRSYRGSGSASYPPSLLLGLLVYGYATGVFSSRKLERATYDSVAFRFIAANQHPDHDTIAAFRRRFLQEIEGLFVQVLEVAREMGLLQMGTVALDGTKIHANASRHSALSYEHAGRIEVHLKAEVADLMARAEAADQADIPDGLSIPDELARREERLAKLADARAKIEARARERFEREQAEYQAKLAARDAKAVATGRKPGGKPPQPPDEGPLATDQINLTDEASRIMPVAGGGFDPCYNAQAVVVARGPGPARRAAGRQRLFQHGQCDGLRGGGDRATDCTGPAVPPLLLERPLRRGAACAGQSHTRRGDGPPPEDAGGQEALCPAQTYPGTGVRHHQIRDGVPPVSAARARQRPR
jgi:transposase